MKWPFGNNLEMRAESYTDTLVGLLVGRAQGKSLSIPTATRRLRLARVPWGAACGLRRLRTGLAGPGP